MVYPAFSYRWRVGAAWLAALALALAFAPAEAATKKTDKADAAKPNLIATFGDWNVFVSQSPKGRICYVLAQPKTREPDSLKRDPGYAFISDRPAEGVRNEVSFIMGFDVSGGTQTADAKSDPKPGAKAGSKPSKAEAKTKTKTKTIAAPLAAVGEESFDLLPKGGNLWVKNAARESALIAEMKKGTALEIRAASLKGNEFDRLLFPRRLFAGDGAAAEGMPAEAVGLSAAAISLEPLHHASHGPPPQLRRRFAGEEGGLRFPPPLAGEGDRPQGGGGGNRSTVAVRRHARGFLAANR